MRSAAWWVPCSWFSWRHRPSRLERTPSVASPPPLRPARHLDRRTSHRRPGRLRPVAIQSTSGIGQLARRTSCPDSRPGSPARTPYVVLDFGKEVGGLVTLNFAGASGAGQQVGLAFTESSLYVGENSDASSGRLRHRHDGAIYATRQRRRHVHHAGGQAARRFPLPDGVPVERGLGRPQRRLAELHAPPPASPTRRRTPNYFHSNDELLNKIWYAGAYTVQLDTIDPNQGRVWPAPSTGWENNGVRRGRHQRADRRREARPDRSGRATWASRCRPNTSPPTTSRPRATR